MKEGLKAAVEHAEQRLLKYIIGKIPVSDVHLKTLLDHATQKEKCSHIFFVSDNDIKCIGCGETMIKNDPCEKMKFLSSLDPEKLHMVIYNDKIKASTMEVLNGVMDALNTIYNINHPQSAKIAKEQLQKLTALIEREG